MEDGYSHDGITIGEDIHHDIDFKRLHPIAKPSKVDSRYCGLDVARFVCMFNREDVEEKIIVANKTILEQFLNFNDTTYKKMTSIELGFIEMLNKYSMAMIKREFATYNADMAEMIEKPVTKVEPEPNVSSRVTCECGALITKSQMSRHVKSKRHIGKMGQSI